MSVERIGSRRTCWELLTWSVSGTGIDQDVMRSMRQELPPTPRSSRNSVMRHRMVPSVFCADEELSRDCVIHAPRNALLTPCCGDIAIQRST